MSSQLQIDSILKYALKEDIGKGDITTTAIIREKHRSMAVLTAKEKFILAGIPFAEKVFSIADSSLKFKADRKDGETIKKGTVIARIKGNTRGLLKAERTALNILQRLSGIATLAHKFTKRVKGLSVKITDTRKTTPGLRYLEKYAVKIGGGHNHRMGLYDGILIKDNHIQNAGGIKQAVRLARKNIQHMLKIEVEAQSMREVNDALSSGAEIIMLDNMSLKSIRKSVKLIRSKNPGVLIEVSGNMTLQNIRETAETGVDLISVGALTHSAVSVDISMDTAPLQRIY